MSDSESFEESDNHQNEARAEDNDTNDDLEGGRVARFFLYKARERQGVRKTQLKPVLDTFRERSIKKKRDPIVTADKLLNEGMGLRIVTSNQERTKNKSNEKHFLVRSKPYPKDVPLPFSEIEMKEYGVLLYVFFIVSFKDKLDLDQLWQILSIGGFPDESREFGRWPEIMWKWNKMDYFKLNKIEDPSLPAPKFMVELGPRFYVEFGEEMIKGLAKDLVTDGEDRPLDKELGATEPHQNTTTTENTEDDHEDDVQISQAPPQQVRENRNKKQAQVADDDEEIESD